MTTVDAQTALLSTYRFEGAWFWLVGALFLIDASVDVLDVLVEPRSRVPPPSYGRIPAIGLEL
jgi:hypothetical protein